MIFLLLSYLSAARIQKRQTIAAEQPKELGPVVFERSKMPTPLSRSKFVPVSAHNCTKLSLIDNTSKVSALKRTLSRRFVLTRLSRQERFAIILQSPPKSFKLIHLSMEWRAHDGSDQMLLWIDQDAVASSGTARVASIFPSLAWLMWQHSSTPGCDILCSADFQWLKYVQIQVLFPMVLIVIGHTSILILKCNCI